MASFTDSLPLLGNLSVPFAPVPAADLTDEALLSAQRDLAEVRRRVEAQAAVVAAEIAHRSRRELGHAGLAASHGQRSAEGLISSLAGTSARDARTLVKAGELQPTASIRTSTPSTAGSPPPPPRWTTVIGDAVATASITVAAAEVIRTRLGQAANRLGIDAAAGPDEQLTDHEADARAALEARLATAAERLVASAPRLTIEQLAERASRERDALDLGGIASREEELRERRFLRLTKQLDGTTRVHGLLDPESAAIVVPILDAATSPRRGGPSFVDPDAAQRAADIERDQRSTEQLTLDTLVDLVRSGARVDNGRLLGDRTPRGPHPGDQARTGRARHRRRTRSRPPRRGRVFRGTDGCGVDRHRRTLHLRRWRYPHPVRRRHRPRAQPRTHPTPLQREAAHRPRRARRRMPHVRPAALLVRSPPHRPLG